MSFRQQALPRARRRRRGSGRCDLCRVSLSGRAHGLRAGGRQDRLRHHGSAGLPVAAALWSSASSGGLRSSCARPPPPMRCGCSPPASTRTRGSRRRVRDAAGEEAHAPVLGFSHDLPRRASLPHSRAPGHLSGHQYRAAGLPAHAGRGRRRDCRHGAHRSISSSAASGARTARSRSRRTISFSFCCFSCSSSAT